MLTMPIGKRSWYVEIIREQENIDGYITAKQGTKRSERVKLDAIMKYLFQLSDRVTIAMINGLFRENHEENKVTVRYENKEFVDDGFNRLNGDLFITIESQDGSCDHYHVEFQTRKDKSMVKRMLRYGLEKATVERGYKLAASDHVDIHFPWQLVIYVEENKTIGEQLEGTIHIKNGAELDFTVPAMRYWAYSIKDLAKQRMYALLPLQVFRLRKAMRVIEKNCRSEEEQRTLMAGQFKQLQQTTRSVAEVLEAQLGHDLNFQEVNGITTALPSITAYLYSRYDGFAKYEEEVQMMIKTFFDPEIYEKGKTEGFLEGKDKGKTEGFLEGESKGIMKGLVDGKLEVARRLLERGLQMEEVAEITGLANEQIRRLLRD